MASDDLDQMLRAYLEREREDPIRKRLENAAQWQIDHEAKDAERFGTVIRTLDSHNFRLGNLEHKAEKIEAEVENTGNHNIEELRARNRRWTDGAWKLGYAAVALILGGGIIEFIHRVSGK